MANDPRVPLKGSPNTRDLGGYSTAAGRRVRFGRLYRSGELSRLTDADVQVVAGLGLTRVLDFRLPGEVRLGGPDRLPAGVAAESIPVGGGSLDGFYALAASGDWDRVDRELGDGKGEHAMAEVYRGFVTSDADRAGFAAALQAVTGAEALPLLFHCTAGKDRAGWLSAIVLRLLGVPQHDVTDDFLLSNAYFLPAAAKLLSTMGVAEQHERLFRPLISQQPSYLQAGFDAAEREFGSFEAFVHKGLNVDAEAVDSLRERLLEPGPA